MNIYEIRKKFGLRVRQLRLSKGFSQDDLAVAAALHRTYISDVERGERNLSLGSIVRLANAFQLPVPDLFPADLTEWKRTPGESRAI